MSVVIKLAKAIGGSDTAANMICGMTSLERSAGLSASFEDGTIV